MSGRMSSVISARSLEDYQVLDARGAKLGTVEDVLLDAKLARTRYFVLSFGAGALGMHKHRYVVPAESVRLDTESEALVVDIAPERFENAAPFDEAGDDPAAVYRL
ncbi:MAG TPA: PRC-barrel domain-containing protein [Gammaproteobacteria bacterium]